MVMGCLNVGPSPHITVGAMDEVGREVNKRSGENTVPASWLSGAPVCMWRQRIGGKL